jgi:L-histidine N-alpha-methyltransferase
MLGTSHKRVIGKVSEFAMGIVNGFSQNPKSLSSRWFYDEAGSHLFSRITELQEYYPTAKEAEILADYSSEIVYKMGDGPWRVVELGAGDGRKTEIFLRAFKRIHADFEFWPIDISNAALNVLCNRLAGNLAGLTCHPVVGDNFDGLKSISRIRRAGERLCLIYLGSSIGNCTRNEVSLFLKNLRTYLMPGDLALIGFDLLKDPDRLWRAYCDSEGITTEFNLNLLRRINRELDGNIDVSAFRHEATWNPHINGMESWLVSTKAQSVSIGALGMTFEFGPWESIHTEISLKFDPANLESLATAHGFKQIELYRDANNDFADALWMAAPHSVS